MGKKKLLFSLLIVGIVVWGGYMSKSSDKQTINNSQMVASNLALASNIEVVHFYGARQCWSCITVGEYALKTIKEKFPEEYANGTIVFKDINGELPENRDIVIKYQARGSSLFVNTITGGEDNIEEDVAVWRVVGSESQFISYFEKKLNKILGK